MMIEKEKVLEKIEDYKKAVNAAAQIFGDDERRGMYEAIGTIRLMVLMMGEVNE